MKNINTTPVLLVISLITALFSASCDSSFYLTEKEFYALRWQFATAAAANQFFSGVQGQQLQINFDNSVSPPRVQSSNLQDFMRNNLSTLTILEGYPNNSFRIDRVSGEVEKQFDNWLASQLQLYSGTNNAQVRLERVEQIRVQFMNNPTFTYTANKIVFNTTLQMTADCRIKVDALDPVTNFLYGGVNGTYDVSIDLNNLQLQGEISLDSAGYGMDTDSSDLQFKMVPTIGSVVARDRGTVVPAVVKNGIRDVVEQSLRKPLIENIERRYDYFALSNCRINTEFTCEYESRPATSTPELHTVARGTDNKLYSAVRRGGAWSGYTELCCSGGPLHIFFTSDPTLTVSSANTVEMVATTSSGEIYYTQYQNGWKNARFVIPPQGTSFRGKPAVVATAPGQLEIFVTRSDNKVLHLRRLNGVWTTPVLVNLPLSVGTIPNIQFVTYRDPVAVQSGNKVVLTAVGSNNRLFTILYDLETGYWGQSSQLSSSQSVSFAPALASSGDGRVDLAYVGASGAPFHRTITISAVNIASAGATIGFSVNAEMNLSGTLSASPMLVASGYRQLDLVARGTDNRLYHKHFTGPSSPTGVVDGRNVVQGWSGWTDLNGNFIGTQMAGYENTEEYALAATKSGKLDLVARIRANTNQTAYTLHHNAFDSYDYARQPWKTALWRGYDSIDPQVWNPSRFFNGRPALAALDTNFATAFVGTGYNIYHSQQGSDFAALIGFQVLSNPTTVDPVSVSSGKGLVDIVAVGTDSKIRHIRYRNNLMLQNNTLPGQTLLFRSRPAVVGYGDGQLDVIGVTTTGSIYHWRLVNGVWQTPRLVSGTVSSPVLVNTGGGQLEFFAIGGDNKLYRWRFLGGAWGNWQQLPSAFTINPGKFGQGAATTAGDGTVDMAVVTNQAGVLVYHRLVEPRDDTVSLPGMPAQTFRSIGSMANSQPYISAAGKTEKLVIANEVNTSDIKYFSLNNSTVWKSELIRGNSLSPLIGGIADLPTGAVAVATDANGKVYFHDRMKAIGPRSDFIPLLGQSSPFWITIPRYRPTVASFSGM